jgi:hypothetical protein
MARPKLYIQDDLPEAVIRILEKAQGVDIRRHRHETLFRVADRQIPTSVLMTVPAALKPHRDKNELGLVVARHLTVQGRAQLEEKGWGYVDARGATHIDVDGVYVHTAPRTSEPMQIQQAPPGIGVVGVRVIQHLLVNPKREWFVTELAHEANCAAGQAQNMLRRLENEGLVATVGKLKERRRKVNDPTALLDFLVEVPAARRVRERIRIYVYGRDVEAVVRRIMIAGVGQEPLFAVTGTAAAAILGVPVTTAVNNITVRVNPDRDLIEVANRLQGKEVDAGSNVTLMRDVGQLGIHGMNPDQPLPIAGDIRIYLDMLVERRGEDAAALFREHRIGF